jgi:predicted ArsR family transcriptional regulator
LILGDLKSYLTAHKQVAITDLANRFDVEPDALRGMLQLWVDKGRVRRLEVGGACGSCARCGDGNPEIYEWVR